MGFYQCKGLAVFISSAIAAVGHIAFYANPSIAQITPDATLPNNSVVDSVNKTLNITEGTQAGGNLFHSFKEFSVPTGWEAVFKNGADIQNILTRVTGKSISEIDGLIKANGSANLFLMNPNGIVFGENASLDIGGSFVGSTANGIGIDNQDFFNGINSQPDSQLLTIKPDALFFNQIQGGKIATNSSELTVPNGESLLLVGGDININGGSLRADGGRIDLAGLAGNGTVGLNIDGNDLSLSVPEDMARADVSLINGAFVDVSGGEGGSIKVNARNLEVKEESELVAGIGFGLGTVESQAGDITINASDNVLFDNSSAFNNVNPEGVGNAGNINIKTGTLEVTNGSQILARNNGGQGDAGSITIDASDTVRIEAFEGNGKATIASDVTGGGVGNGNHIKIDANSIFIENDAVIAASIIDGKGKNEKPAKAGDVKITAKNQLVVDEGRIYSEVGSKSHGEGGTILIKAPSVTLDNNSSLITRIKEKGRGEAGNIKIETGELSLKGGSKILAQNDGGQGNAGNINIETDNLSVKGGSQILARNDGGRGDAGSITIDASDTVRIEAFEGNGGATIASDVTGGGVGNGNDIKIDANSIFVENDAVIAASILSGKGENGTAQAGDVNITAKNQLVVDEGRIYSEVGSKSHGQGGTINIKSPSVSLDNNASLITQIRKGGQGGAGDINIETDNLLIKGGSSITASTRSAGNGGSLNVKASESIEVIGRSDDGKFGSGVYAQQNTQGATGNAGDLNIKTANLVVRDGARISASTYGAGKGGNLNVTADESLEVIGEFEDGKFSSGLFADARSGKTGNAGNLTIKTANLLVKDGAQIGAGTFGAGNGGNLNVTAGESIKVIGNEENLTGLFTQGNSKASGDAGELNIINTKVLLLNQGTVAARNLGKGNSGSLNIKADSIALDNNALVTASTRSVNKDPNNPQANINIDSQDLILRGKSDIFANAREENVVGGNINIDSGAVAVLEKSSIRADSRDSRGGRVTINTQGLFGTQPWYPEALRGFITATGATPDLSGDVQVNTQVDPNNGLIELPENIVDASNQISNACTPGGSQFQNEFISTGRGGLPMNPTEPLQETNTIETWVRLKPQSENSASTRIKPSLKKVANSNNHKVKKKNQIVEATGWIVDKDGNIEFVAQANQINPNTKQTASCAVPK